LITNNRILFIDLNIFLNQTFWFCLRFEILFIIFFTTFRKKLIAIMFLNKPVKFSKILTTSYLCFKRKTIIIHYGQEIFMIINWWYWIWSYININQIKIFFRSRWILRGKKNLFWFVKMINITNKRFVIFNKRKFIFFYSINRFFWSKS